MTNEVRCEACGRMAPNYDIVSCGSIEHGYRQLCGNCFNAEVAQFAGLKGFEDVQFQPIVLTDCNGEPHEFHVRTHLFGNGIALDAFELRGGSPAGYQFQIIGDPQDDLFILLGKLMGRMRRALAVKHLSNGTLGLQIEDNKIVRGRIEWDAAQDGHVPLLVIDGREITWDEFGHMLMTFEGFQFKLRIVDKSDEL
jgi:hypothetical protein